MQLHRVGDGAILASLMQPGTPTALSFSPDGTLLGVVLDSNSVAVWDLGGDVSQPLMLPPHKGEVRMAAAWEASREGVFGGLKVVAMGIPGGGNGGAFKGLVTMMRGCRLCVWQG